MAITTLKGYVSASCPIRRFPHPRSCFFKQPVLKGQISNVLLKDTCLTVQVRHLGIRRSTRSVASKPARASFHELLRPSVMQALHNTFLAAQLSNAVFAAQVFRHDPDFVFIRKVPPCYPARIPITTRSAEAFGRPTCLVSFSLLRHYDETKTLLKSQHQICALGADGEQGIVNL